MAEPRFDLFLSHNSKDKPAVRKIAHKLREAGFEPWLDAEQIRGGRSFKEEIAIGLRASRGCAIFYGPHGLSDWVIEELDVAMSREKKVGGYNLFLVLLPGVPDDFQLQSLPESHPITQYLLNRQVVDLRTGIDDAGGFQQFLNAMPVVRPNAPPDDEVPCPYRGLDVFDEEHAEFYFGRETNIERMLEKLKESRFLAVVGPSGTGKSSLVRAGLIPALRQGRLPGSDSWPILKLRPGARPLTDVLAPQLIRLGAYESMGQALDDLRRDPRTLDLAASLALADLPPASRLVLVIDQFEELFTLCHDPAERDPFLANLLHAATVPDGRCVVIITLRADFYARGAAYPELAALLADHQELVAPLDERGLRAVIVEPARKVGLRFEPHLVDRILDDVSHQPGALPLLQHALLELWIERDGRVLTWAGYQKVGGVAKAIANRADKEYENLDPAQRKLAERIFLRLTEPGEGTEDTRRQARFDELITQAADEEAVQRVVDRLVAARLLTTDTQDEAGKPGVVDVTHEALIRAWPRLQEWLADERDDLRVHRRLTEAALEWEREGNDEDLLWRGARLAEATEFAERRSDSLNALEGSFVAASIALHERELAEIEERRRSRERAQRLILAGLSAGLILLLSFAVFAWNQRGEAQDQSASRAIAVVTAEAAQAQAEAEAEAKGIAVETAQAAATEAIAARALAEDEAAAKQVAVETAEAAATEAIEAKQTADAEAVRAGNAEGTAQAERREAEEASQRANANRLAMEAALGFDPYYLSLLFSLEAIERDPEGRHPRSHFPRTLQKHPKLSGFLQDPESLAMNGNVCYVADGTRVAGRTAEGSVVLWDATTRQPVARLGEGQGGASFGALACSPVDSTIAVSGGEDGAIVLWDAERLEETGRLEGGHDQIPLRLAFSPDGETLVSSDGLEIIFWDVARGIALSGGEALPADPVVSFAYSAANGTAQFAVGTSSGEIYVTERGSDQVGDPLSYRHGGWVYDLAFSADGRFLAAAGADGYLSLFNLETGENLAVSNLEYRGEKLAVAFSPISPLLVVGGRDTRIWVIDVENLTLVDRLEAGGQDVHTGDLAFSPDGAMVASTSNSGAIALWAIENRNPRIASWLSGFADFVPSVALSPDERILATGTSDGRVALWDLADRQCRAVLTPDGSSLDCQSLVDQPIDITQIEAYPFHALAFSRDGTLLATGDAAGTIRLWDVAERELVGELRDGHDTPIYGLAFDREDGILASLDLSSRLVFWELATQTMIGEPIQAHMGISYLAVNAEGTMLATAGQEIKLWDFQTQQQSGDALTYPFANWVSAVKFEGDDRLVAVLQSGGILSWKLSTREQEPVARPFSDHTGFVTDLEFSPLYRGTSGVDGRIWLTLRTNPDVVFSLDVFGALNAPMIPVYQIVFTEDGQTLVAATEQGVLVWNLDEAEWRERACSVANRNLTREEWRYLFGDEPYRRTCSDLPEPTPLALGTLAIPEATPNATPGVEASPVAAVP